jgi:cytoskeletal protein CcmA (bactofilin family)
MRRNLSRILVSSVLLTLFALSITTPALAFDGRGGDNIVIGKDEVINDDLYVGAQNFTLDGTVKGDVVAAGAVITINGTVEGDLIAAGQAVIVNGTVADDVRIAGGALLVGDNARIGGDVIAVGGSLEVRKGSSVGNDIVFGGGQALLNGDIARNVNVGGGGLEIHGTIGGDVKASLGDPEQAGPGPMMYMPNSPIPIPNVQAGLKIDPAAKIEGKLEYVSNRDLNFPGGVVLGPITRIEPAVNPEKMVKTPTMGQQVVNGTLDMLRNMVTLILIGLALVWLFPNFVRTTAERIRTAPLPSLGWGVVSWAAFLFSLMVIFVATLLGGIIFRVLTLGGVSGAIVWLGVVSMFALVIGFCLAVFFVAKIVVAIIGGKLILARVKPEWAEHKVWPLLLGVVLLAILVAIPFVGWLINLIVVLVGLGALWFYGRELMQHGRPVAEQPVG